VDSNLDYRSIPRLLRNYPRLGSLQRAEDVSHRPRMDYSRRGLVVDFPVRLVHRGLHWWSISQSAWFIEAYTRFDVLTMMVATLVGIGLTVYLFFHVIRFTERRTPKDPPITPLDERERRLVTEMIRRNLGGGE